QEGVDDLEPLQGTGLALSLPGADDLAQALGLGLQVEVLQALLDRAGAHRTLEVVAVPLQQFAVEQLVTLEVADLEVLELLPDQVQVLQIGIGTLAQLCPLAFGAGPDLAARLSRGPPRTQFRP